MSLSLPALVEELQQKTSFQRRRQLIHILQDLSVPYQEQEFSLDYHANILVDISHIPPTPWKSVSPSRALISGYYDGARTGYGIAVLLGLVEEQASTPVLPCLLRFLFLDAHDGHPSGLEAYGQMLPPEKENTPEHQKHSFHLHLENVNEKTVCYLLEGALQCQMIKDNEHYLESAVNVLSGMIKLYSQAFPRQIQQSRGMAR